MDSIPSILYAHEFVKAHEREQARLQNMKDIVQRGLESGVTHLDNPARISYYYDMDKHFGANDSVSISAEHYEFIKDILTEEICAAQEVGVPSDGPTFPKKYDKALIEALETRRIAWKHYDRCTKVAWGTPHASTKNVALSLMQ